MTIRNCPELNGSTDNLRMTVGGFAGAERGWPDFFRARGNGLGKRNKTSARLRRLFPLPLPFFPSLFHHRFGVVANNERQRNLRPQQRRLAGLCQPVPGSAAFFDIRRRGAMFSLSSSLSKVDGLDTSTDTPELQVVGMTMWGS